MHYCNKPMQQHTFVHQIQRGFLIDIVCNTNLPTYLH